MFDTCIINVYGGKSEKKILKIWKDLLMKDGLVQISTITSSVPLSSFACSLLCLCVNNCVCEKSVSIFLKPGSHCGGLWIPECYGQIKEERST